MLWKYKKCYQETSEDVIITPPEMCQFVDEINAVYTGAEFDPGLSTIEYILFGDVTNTIVTIPMDSITINIDLNVSIKQGTLFVDGINIVTSDITLTPFWSVEVIFDECPVEGLYSALISNSSQVDPTDSCNLLTLDNTVYIQQQNIGFITVGDIIYTDSLATTPFSGNGEFYKMKAINSNIYTAEVDAFGVVLGTPGFGICV